jgi:CubicO group peptidase (beta-lactamase class C family)
MDALGVIEHWPVDAAAVGVVGTDPARQTATTFGRLDRRFPWASVTKPATALAVLVAVEEGTLRLDDPAGPPGSTVRHLLAHASGLGPEPGAPMVAPGTARIYSNAGYMVLGDLLADRSGMPFGAYLRAGVLEPLGMTDTSLDDDDPAGAAAAGLAGPVVDLLALGREWAVPTLISPETHGVATQSHFPELAGVLPGFRRFDPCPWGLGVEIRGTKWPHWTGRTNSPSTYGHFGRSGSFLWIDPVAGLVCAGLADRRFGPWATQAWPELADAVVAEWSAPFAPSDRC